MFYSMRTGELMRPGREANTNLNLALK